MNFTDFFIADDFYYHENYLENEGKLYWGNLYLNFQNIEGKITEWVVKMFLEK